MRDGKISSGTRCLRRWETNEDGEQRLQKRCNRCEEWKDAELDYYTDKQYGQCKECRGKGNKAYRLENLEELREYRRQWYEGIKDDPYWKAKEAKARKLRKQPTKARKAEHDKKRYERLYADPEKHAAFLAKRRIYYKIKREERGITGGTKGRPPLKFPEKDPTVLLHVGPIRKWVEDRIERDGGRVEQLQLESGLSKKRIWEVRCRNQYVELHTIEKLISLSSTRLEDLYPDVDSLIAA